MFLSLTTCISYAGQLTIRDLKTVRRAVWGARTKWMYIGLELDIFQADLDAIQAIHRGDIGECLTEMLALWLKQVDPPPTWTALVAALQIPVVGCGYLVEQVESKYVHVSDVTDSGPATENQEGKFIG